MIENIPGQLLLVVVWITIAVVIGLISDRLHRKWVAEWLASDGEGWRVQGTFPDMTIRTETVELRFVKIGQGKGSYWESQFSYLSPTTLVVLPNRWWPLRGPRFESNVEDPWRAAIEEAYRVGLTVEAGEGKLVGKVGDLCAPAEARHWMARVELIADIARKIDILRGVRQTVQHSSSSS